LDRAQIGNSLLEVEKHRPGAISAAIIYNQNFMGDIVEPQFNVQLLNSRADATFLIARRHDDRE
jgi:hypothetical protein